MNNVLHAALARLSPVQEVATVDFFDTLVKAMPREFFTSSAPGIRGTYVHNVTLICKRERYGYDHDYETYVFAPAPGESMDQLDLTDFIKDITQVATAAGFSRVKTMFGLAAPKTFVIEVRPTYVRLTLTTKT